MVSISISEELAKFIFNKSQFSSSNNRVKYSVFLPPPNRRLSVFRISGLSVQEVWEIGETVGLLRAIPLSPLARADIKASSVLDAELEIDADDIPPRHANIVGWLEEDSAIKLKAIELAEKAQLHLK